MFSVVSPKLSPRSFCGCFPKEKDKERKDAKENTTKVQLFHSSIMKAGKY